MNKDVFNRLNLKHLRLISAIAQYGQLSVAADSLHMTQPAASRLLAEIEQNVSAKLFERYAQGMRSTLIGQALVKRANHILIEMHSLTQEVEALKGGDLGVTRVAAVTGAAVGYMVPAIHKLKQQSPQADIHINVAPSAQLVQELLLGAYDFILARIPEGFDSRDFAISPARVETVQLMVRKDHPLVQPLDGNRLAAEIINLADLQDYPWVMQAHGAPVRDAVENAFIEARADIPKNITNTSSLLVMMALLASSDSISAVATEVADLLIEQPIGASLARLTIAQPITVTPYYLITNKGHQLSPLAERLQELVMAELMVSSPFS